MDTPLHAVFLEEVADIYNAEQQLAEAFPSLVTAAEGKELHDILEHFLGETEAQVRRIKDVLIVTGEVLQRRQCKAMAGLLKETKEAVKDHAGEPCLDAVLIAMLQKIKHYEIATYGTLVAWAKRMQHEEAAEFFQQTLQEEKASDEKLTHLAEGSVNEQAQTRQRSARKPR